MAKGDVNKITMLLFYYKWAMISHYYSTEIKSFYSNKFPSDQENNSRNISYLQKPHNIRLGRESTFEWIYLDETIFI
jgi:hypothetical protein